MVKKFTVFQTRTLVGRKRVEIEHQQTDNDSNVDPEREFWRTPLLICWLIFFIWGIRHVFRLKIGNRYKWNKTLRYDKEHNYAVCFR